MNSRANGCARREAIWSHLAGWKLEDAKAGFNPTREAAEPPQLSLVRLRTISVADSDVTREADRGEVWPH
jgi:hypothetical protein